MLLPFLILLTLLPVAKTDAGEFGREILVTFNNPGTSTRSAGVSAPYRFRKRYSIATLARKSAEDIAGEYALTQIDHWPIRSLSVYCIVYRVHQGRNRDAVIKRLKQDKRIESVQPLQQFVTGTGPSPGVDYDDTYARLQYGLQVLDLASAHKYSRGNGVRIAIVDSQVDSHHEDLRGRVFKTKVFVDPDSVPNHEHGTAVTSVIGANANNARGIVGIAPEARMELFVSCWAKKGADTAVCDSFTLAKALDSLLDDPPDILNLSLTGPTDPLLERLLNKVFLSGAIIVAASSATTDPGSRFPAILDQVISVGSSVYLSDAPEKSLQMSQGLYAPGQQIMVAIPDDGYDFRSGSSLAAAHVSGVIALLLAVSPQSSYETVVARLRDSQSASPNEIFSVNACRVLHLEDSSRLCRK